MYKLLKKTMCGALMCGALLLFAACNTTGNTTGNTDGKAELASKSELYTGKEYKKAFSNPTDNPSQPNVLLIGDSISIGYTIPVRKLLNGKVDVFRIPCNGKYASYGAKKIKKWIGKQKWDVIHFNWGLWDLCYRNPKSKTQGHRDKINGKLQATQEQYLESMKKIIAELKKTDAKLIWCETTPVPEFEMGRKAGDAIKYNLILEKLMKENGIVINRLHAHALKKSSEIQKAKGDVHFTKEGYEYLAKKVAEEISTLIQK